MEHGVPHSTSRLRVFILVTSTRPTGMSLPQTALVKLNRLRTGFRRFYFYMHKWGLISLLNYECASPEQTTDQILTAFLSRLTPHGAQSLTDPE